MGADFVSGFGNHLYCVGVLLRPASDNKKGGFCVISFKGIKQRRNIICAPGTIKGKGNFTGTYKEILPFTIVAQDILVIRPKP